MWNKRPDTLIRRDTLVRRDTVIRPRPDTLIKR